MQTDMEHYASHRPRIHYSPPSGWMNDPNGLVYAYGYYHLFYQHFPHGLQHGPMYWGHARSRDLIRWENLPIALCPDELGHIYSGSAILDYRNASGLGKGGLAPLLLFFTHHRRNETEGQVQCQSIAYSTDGGTSFEKYAENPVIASSGNRNFRDPKVIYHEESGAFVMVVAAGRKLMFYRSENLLSWDFSGGFSADGIIPHDGTLECPDLIRLPTSGGHKWLLLISVTKTENEDWNMGYLTGDFDGKAFITDGQPFRALDGGCDHYAAVTFNGVPDGRTIMLGWMNCWNYADKIPAKDFRGSMTFPRTLSFVDMPDGLCLSQTPVAEAYDGIPIKNIGLDSQKVPINVPLAATPFILNINCKYDSFTVTLKNEHDSLNIIFDADNKCIVCDRSKCGKQGFSPLFTKILRSGLAQEAETVDMQIIVDVTSVEIFALGGRNVITAQFFTNYPFNEAIISGAIQLKKRFGAGT